MPWLGMGKITELESANYINKLDGQQEVTSAVRKTRYEVCAECSKLSKWLVCEECNCWMPVKARLPMTKCPLGKW